VFHIRLTHALEPIPLDETDNPGKAGLNIGRQVSKDVENRLIQKFD